MGNGKAKSWNVGMHHAKGLQELTPRGRIFNIKLFIQNFYNIFRKHPLHRCGCKTSSVNVKQMDSKNKN